MAHDAAATLAEAHELRSAVDRENVLRQDPGDDRGHRRDPDATAAGISVNVTLIFGLERYREVIDAYLSGLERARDAGRDLGVIQSVASFFVSRVDVEVDRRLAAFGDETVASELTGRAAIANARLAYEMFEQSIRSPRWLALEEAGATRQRPLWASTGVKDPRMRDTVYVEELVAPQTVNTMPEKTLEAVWDHGRIAPDTVTGDYDDARRMLERFAAVGISITDVAGTLETAGIATFSASWDRLIAIVGAGIEST